ncbi:MAG TPA: acetate kinase, partial [Candidatus Limnocylindrales bacterium]|nr:acetate kinase [Candidatus Limnocylindrales bacterium]
LEDLAPLHNPPATETIRATSAALSGATHVATFDTAFHATLPEAARRYPVPDQWLTRWGVRRYGFHGLSVEWSVRRATELLGRSRETLRIVVAHLGGGSSVTAVDGGRSAFTSMGMTPLEGLMMATRSGSIDPGAIIRVLRGGRSLDDVADDLEHRSGLLGVSGRSSDMRALLSAEAAGDERSTLAIEMFVRRAAAGIAVAATALPGLDAIVFTGGIGENAGRVRQRITERLAALGVRPVADGEGGDDHVLDAGRPAILRVHAREDLVIADAAAELVQ